MFEFFKAIGPGVAMALFGSALTFAGTSFWANRANKNTEKTLLLQRIQELETNQIDLKTNMAVVGQAVQPLTMAMQAMLVKQLTHYHEPRTDELLAKLDPFVLTDAEENELFARLAQRTIDMDGRIPPIERIYAKALPLVIAMVRHELNVSMEIATLTVVAVTTKDESRNNQSTVELKMIAVPRESKHGDLGD